MSVTPEKLTEFAKQLAALAAIFNPGAAATVQLLVAAAAQLNEMVALIKQDDPEMWAKISADFNSAAAAYEAAVPKK